MSSNIPSGDPDILFHVGQLYFKEQHYQLSEYYLILSSTHESSTLLSNLYIKWMQLNDQFHDDIGRYALKGVLSFILSEEVESAINFISNFMVDLQVLQPQLFLNNNTSEDLKLTKSHCLNFSQLIIATIQRTSTPNIDQHWKSIVSHFKTKSNIINSPSVTQACNEIGSLYFDIRPLNSGNNMMDLMSSILGGGNLNSNQSKRKLDNKINVKQDNLD